MSRRYLTAVILLAVLAVAFGVFGTVAPPLTEENGPTPQQESSSESVGHFQNPPTYDSGWVDISSRAGQYVTLTHGLNTTEVVVDITGKQRLDPMGGSLAWRRTYGGTGIEYGYSLIQTSDGGFALAGSSNTPFAINDDYWLVRTDAAGNKLWERFYGGTGYDYCYSVIQTDDGGFALAGYSNSVGTAGFYDFWLVKTDAAGNKLWDMFYGGTSQDTCYSLIHTSDGGYALAGASGSTGSHGGYDFWLVKTDASGNPLWNMFYGGSGQDYAYSLVQLDSGEYVLAGSSTSTGTHGVQDFWLVKTDAFGNKLWGMFYGGTGTDIAYSLIRTSDSGFALAGYSNSPGATGGSNDFWLVKTDGAGNKLWDRFYGGTGDDQARSLVENEDGEYALAGYSNSPGTVGYMDAWLIKTNSTGSVLWNKRYGGYAYDYLRSLVLMSDGGYAFGGDTNSYGAPGDSNAWLVKVNSEMNKEHRRNLGEASVVSGWSRTYGGTGVTAVDYGNSLIQIGDGDYVLLGSNVTASCNYDAWLIKTDPSGYKLWEKFYGRIEEDDWAGSLVQTSDGGFALAGSSNSTGTAGFNDFWLVKIDASGTKQWDKFYGGTGYDEAMSLVQTSDGGFALAGWSNSTGSAGFNDFWLVRTDASGNKLWGKFYGGGGFDEAYSLIQTSDGGFALAGWSNSTGSAGLDDFWLVKTDAAGNKLWDMFYGGTGYEWANSLIQTDDGGYALAGSSSSIGVAGLGDLWLVRTDASGNKLWGKFHGGSGDDQAHSLIQTSDGGFALVGRTNSFGAGGDDAWLVRTDASGNIQWSKTYGGARDDDAWSMIQTADGAFAFIGDTVSYGGGNWDLYFVKTDVENGLNWVGSTNRTITLYRGKTDLYWNYVRVRMWLTQEPSWIYGDVNMDGVVDAKDLYIVGRNYGKTFSLLSLSGIIAVAGIQTVKNKRKLSKQLSYIS